MNARASDSPVFIVGTPRSGTTLLRLVLDSHPDLAIAPESAFLFRFIGQAPRYYHHLKAREDVARLVADVLSLPRIEDWFPKHRTAEDVVDRIPLPGDPASVIRAIYENYVESRGKRRWGDKTPRNLSYCDRILSLFPDAKILVVIRDCRDVALSLREVDFGGYSMYGTSKRWAVEAGIAAELQGTRPDSVRCVRYEDFVSAPETETEEMLRFLGAAPCPDLLERYRRHFDDVTHSKSALYRKPISTDQTERWKKKLTPFETSVCEAVAGGELRRWGYGLSTEDEDSRHPSRVLTRSPTTMRGIAAYSRLRDGVSRLSRPAFLRNYFAIGRLVARGIRFRLAGPR